MRITFNNNIYNYRYNQYKSTPHRQQAVSFRAAPKEVKGSEILKAAKTASSYLTELIAKEKAGEVAPIDWNITDHLGDNILMLLLKSRAYRTEDVKTIHKFVDFANSEARIDVNYVNEKQGYSLVQCALSHDCRHLDKILKLKNLEVDKVAENQTNLRTSILKFAIIKQVSPLILEDLICHPLMDFSKYSPFDLFELIDTLKMSRYHDLAIGKASYYKHAIEVGLKVQNAKKAKEYYEKNGILTLEQIYDHVNNTDCKRAINMSLSDLEQTIAHFLAETYVNPNDEKSVELVKRIMDKLRYAEYDFEKTDALGRTAPKLAADCENIIVLNAMKEAINVVPR